MARFGKVVGEAQYLHKSAVSMLTEDEKTKLLKCLDLIDETTHWNVVKFDLKEPNKVSLLEYSSFSEDAFPVLLNGTNIDLSSNAISIGLIHFQIRQFYTAKNSCSHLVIQTEKSTWL